MKNLDKKTVDGFSFEWGIFDQSQLNQAELQRRFEEYFEIFPWEELPENASGFDLGCGSGRWAKLVAPKVAELYCIDPSNEALDRAKKNLFTYKNVIFHLASVDSIPLKNNSMDFGYSIGVLHHLPDTKEGMRSCVEKLKPGAPFLVYIYYAFENRTLLFRLLWRFTDILRFFICRTPNHVKLIFCQIIAFLVYLPLARIAKILEIMGFEVDGIPLSAYRDLSYYTMRTDALDRFGTRIEKRFTKNEIKQMMKKAGLINIQFNHGRPYYVALGHKA